MKTAFLSALCCALCCGAMSTTATASPLHANRVDDAPLSVVVPGGSNPATAEPESAGTAEGSTATAVLSNVTNVTTGNAYSTIQEAIDAATAGDVISLAAGTFSPAGQITVNKALSLTGAGSGNTTIQAGGTGYGISISADNVHLEGFTLDGAATFGVKASGVSNFSLQDVAAINGNNSAIDLNGVSGATLTDISASNTALGYGLAISSSSEVTVNGITTSSNAFGAIGIFPAQTQYQAAGLEAPSNIAIGGTVSLNGGAGAVTVQNGALASGGTWVGSVSNDAAANADVTVPAGFTHAVFSTRNDGLTGQSVASQAVIAGLVAYGAANPIPGITFEDVYVYDMVEGDYEVFAPLLIQDAIDAASDGDAITVADGTYAIETPITISKAVTLQGQSEAGVLLECGAGLGGANSIQVTAGATLKDFTLNANSFATFGIHVQPGTANATLSGLTITNTASNGIGLSGVTNATVSDIAGSGNVQYVLGIAGSVGVTASDISGGNVGVYKGTGTYAQSATDIAFTGTFDLAGGFVIEQLAGADEITYSIDGSAADVTLPASFDRAFFANYTDLPLPPPYNVASLATLVEADNLATVIGTALTTEQLGFFTLNDVAVYNLTAAQWEVSAGLSIQDAIDRAAVGDVIAVAAGTYAEDIALNKGLTLNGPNAGISHDGSRSDEAVIDGEHTLDAAAAVTLDGLQFLSNNPAQTSTVYVTTAAGHAIQNNRFVSSIAGGNTGGTHDLGVYTASLPAGSLTISNNSFSGDGSFADGDRYSTAAWGRGIWLNGGAASVTIAGNAFTNCRTGMNLEGYENSACSVDGNRFTDCGSGMSLSNPAGTEITTITANEFQDVDTDLNLRNLTVPVTWNLAATGNTALPGNSTHYSDLGYIPGNAAGDIDDPNGNLNFLAGNGADNLTFGADDNTVTGDFTAAADDILDGGDGTDVAQYADNLADLTITASGNGVSVSSPTAGTDHLTNFEVIRAADGDFAIAIGCTDVQACNYTDGSTVDDGSCTYPLHPDFDCDGNCNNDADGDGICDELEGLLPELEEACGQGTVWDAALGQCIMDVGCIGDVDLDGAVTSTDLLYMLGNFGSFCPGYGPDTGE